MTLIYLTGVTNDEDEPALVRAGIGLMLQPNNSYHRRADRYPCWAYDNGAFSKKWVEEAWLKRMEIVPRDRCLFAVAPDVYPDPVATLRRSEQYFDLIHEMGFPVALVAQDGAERLELPWEDFDCLFIGGKRTPSPRDEWKTSAEAEQLVRQARNHGKWVHMGRVNSLSRARRAQEMGVLSVDGTFLKYRRRASGHEPRAQRGVAELTGWIDWLDKHPTDKQFEAPSLPIYRKVLS